MNKKIIILGGSKLQLDLIFEAKKMYFEVHLFDSNIDCIGKKYADKFYNIDFSKKEIVLEYSRMITPEAVLTIATEVGNITACYVSEKLGLNSNSYEVSLITTNKVLMKKHINKNNIFCKYLVTNKKENPLWNNYPCIVKPVDSSAGRGVSYVESEEYLGKAITEAKKYTSSSEIIIEEYIKGKQYSIESISSKSKHMIVAIVEEFITTPPKIIETQQLVPARISIEKENKIKSFVMKVLDLFNIEYGATHVEVREDEKGNLFLVEIASRMGGWRSELIRLALGINYCELLINSVLNKNISFDKAYDKISAVKMILEKNDLEEYLEYEKKYPNNIISDLNLSIIKESSNLADSNGFYFVCVENKNEIDNFIEKH